MEIFEIQNQPIQTTYKNIFGLNISDDILAVISITLFVFIIGGIARWVYEYFQKLYKKKEIKNLVRISVKLMSERISKQLDYLLTFIEVLKDTNIKDLIITIIYPYQIKTILSIPNNDLYMAYKKNSKKYNLLVTNIHLINSIFSELKKLYSETTDKLFGYQEDWNKSSQQLVKMYDNFRNLSQEQDTLFESIKPLYVDWVKYENKGDFVRALKFVEDFSEKCRAHLPDNRALSFVHLANDMKNIILDYQNKTIRYSEDFNFYRERLSQAHQELKEAIT